MSTLHYLSEKTVEDLKGNMVANLDRYLTGDFQDLSNQNGWNIELEDRDFNLDLLSQLDGESPTASGDLTNSKLVLKALGALTPSEACEPQIWLRLSHVEGLEYSRTRWLKNSTDRDKNLGSIRTHFFAKGRTGIRDDHAISRLWWNGYVAKQAFPDDPERALTAILSSADIRSGIFERSWISNRINLLRGILRSIEANDTLKTESIFREYIITVNRIGAGIIFETLEDDEIDTFLAGCLPS